MMVTTAVLVLFTAFLLFLVLVSFVYDHNCFVFQAHSIYDFRNNNSDIPSGFFLLLFSSVFLFWLDNMALMI